eukprot:8980549-Pyramimonas_sp.AAC.1
MGGPAAPQPADRMDSKKAQDPKTLESRKAPRSEWAPDQAFLLRALVIIPPPPSNSRTRRHLHHLLPLPPPLSLQGSRQSVSAYRPRPCPSGGPRARARRRA